MAPASPGSTTTTLVGQKLGSVRVDEHLGSGGMGDVYRGFDESLERPVALKRLQQPEDRTEVERARFLREARLLSQLDHPHICRIYNLEETPIGDFLVLELIDGQPLDQVLRADLGDLQGNLRIAAQIADALAAAHSQHIVHRDLKPGNIMLTEAGDVKVLDFGVARRAHQSFPSGDSPSLTESPPSSQPSALGGDETTEVLGKAPSPSAVAVTSGEAQTVEGSVIGTARYMSPEQARGVAVTEASDVFALGVLFQELLTGIKAHPSNLRGVETLERVIRGTTRPVENLDAELTRWLERMKSLHPEDRPSAAEVHKMLVARLEARGRRTKKLLLALSLMAAVGISAATTWLVSQSPGSASVETIDRLAVLPLENRTGDSQLEWLGLGLASMVASSLDELPGLAVTEVGSTVSLMEALSISPSAGLPETSLSRIGRGLGADGVLAITVTGSDERAEGLDLEYTIWTPDRTLQGLEVHTKSSSSLAPELIRVLAERLRPSDRAPTLAEQFSFDAIANSMYAMGLTRFSSGGANQARAYFEVAVDRDPDFLRAELQRGNCIRQTGEAEIARAIFEDVLDRAATRDQLKVQAEAHLALAEMEIVGLEHEQARTNLRAALDLQVATNDLSGQSRSLERLGIMAYRREEFGRAENLWSRARELASGLDKTLQLANLARQMGYLRMRQKRPADARAQFEDALQGYRTLEHKDGEGMALGSLGVLADDQGDFRAAERHYREALALARETGNSRVQHLTFINLAAAHFALGNEQQALDLSRESIPLARTTGDQRSLVHHLGALGYYAARQGSLDEASEALQEARDIATDSDALDAEWQLRRNLGYLEIRRGRFPQAKQHLDAALELRRNKLVLMGLARYWYAVGQSSKAVEFAHLARQDKPEIWTDADQAQLEFYQQADRSGEGTPLPRVPGELDIIDSSED